MADIQTLLDQALAPAPVATPTPAGGAIGLALQAEFKKGQVAEATNQKQNDLGKGVTPELYQAATGLGTNLGSNTMPDLEADLRTMNPASLYLKYGASAGDLISGFAEATRTVARDNTRTRGNIDAGLDFVSGAGGALVNTLGGIAALGVGTVSPEGGAAITEGLNDVNAYIQEGQSPALAAARRGYEARFGLEKRDNTAQYSKDIAEGQNDIYASIKRWNSDFGDALNQTVIDDRLLSEGTASAAGSLVGAGAITAGLKKIGAAVLGTVGTPAAIKLAAGINRSTKTLSVAHAADTAASVGSKAAFPIAVGAMEAGGVYQQTMSEVQATPFDSLEQTSEEFRTNKQNLIAQGLDEATANEQARTQLANDTALHAAAIQAPVAAATSVISRLGERPFHVPSVGQVARSVLLNEPLEEGLQSTTGQISQNIAIQARVDPSKRLSENVGEQSAQGALYGLTSAASVQAPALATKATIAGGKAVYQGGKAAIDKVVAAGKPLFNAIIERGDMFLREQQNASPIGDAVMQQAAADVTARAPQATETMTAGIDAADATPEQKAEGKDYVSSLVQAMQFDPKVELEGAPESIVDMVGDATNRIEAIHMAARTAARATTESELMTAASVMYTLMQPLNELKESDPDILSKIPADSEARQEMMYYEKLIQNMDNNPSVQRALRAVKDAVEKSQGNIAPVTEANLGTQEATDSVNQAVAVAGLVPDQGNPEAIEGILKHASEGRLNLTPFQRTTLTASLNLIKARKAQEEQIKNSGLQSAKDVVSSQIVAGNDPLRTHAQSALQHTQGVMQAMRSGNLTVAQARLEDFGLFVQHMKNKVEALNRHFANGNPNADGVPYDALMPVTREFRSSQDNPKALHKALFVNTSSPKSLDQAQSIELEQKTLADVYNGLVDAFPALDMKKIEPLALPDALHGNPTELARKFRTPVAKAEPKTEVTPAAAEKIIEAVSKPVETPTSKVEEITPKQIEIPLETKVEAKPEPKVETVDKTAVKTENQQENKPANAMDALYPKLLSSVPNYLKKVFNLPKSEQPISRLVGQGDSVVSLVQDALKSVQRFNEFIGKSLTHEYTSDIAARYKQFLTIDPKAAELWKKADAGKATDTEAVRLQNVGGIMATMESHLQDFLNSKYDKNQTFAQALKNGVEANRFSRGKALNIVDEVDGKYQYNPELLQSTALAAMQWLLVSDHYETVLTQDNVAAISGLNAGEISNELENKIAQGMSTEQAKRILADKINKYWGVTAPNTADMAYSEGIPEAVAAEAIRALVDLGMLRQIEINLTEADGVPEPKTIYRFTTSNDEGQRWIDLEDPIRQYSTAIDDAVLTTPEQLYFINGDVPPVAERQMNNPDVKNTPEQKTAIANEQKTPFYLHAPVANLYRALGVDGLLNLLGGGDTENRVLNINHKASLQGQNITILGAYRQLMNTVAEMSNQGTKKGTDLGATSIRYGYNISRVGRLQMLGKYNPQANKLMREAILPTWSTLDLLENADHKTAFGQALAQALGVKVHKMSPAQAVTSVIDKLLGPLAPAVEIVKDWVANNDINASPLDSNEDTLDHEALKTALNNAGVGITANALHALVEYARFDAATDEEKSKFKTPLYLEADGVTNGPINAMALMSIGKFNTDWVGNVAKGGFSFGGPQPMHTLDKKDLYQTTTERTSAHLANLINKMGAQKNKKYILENVGNLLNLMGMTLPDVGFDPTKTFENGALTLERGIAKNPLTITIYGSSAGGIANKLTSMVTDSIYQMLSDASTAMANDKSLTIGQALFPNEPDPAAKAKQFFDAINNLTESQVLYSRDNDSFYRKENENVTRRKFDPETFTFNKDEIASITQNMLEIFVNPMRSGIEDTVGSALMKSVTQVRQATQVQSIVTNHLFNDGVYARIDEKNAEDKTRRKGDFVSRADLAKITKGLSNVSPLVQPDGQVFFVVKSQEMSADSFQYGRALNDTLRTSADFYAPGNAGVAGIPFLTIGMGDGKMMQNLALDTSIENTLKIFDGMNMPLDKTVSYSTKTNQAVYDSWKGNPLRAVKESYDGFMTNGLDTVKKLLDSNAKTYEENSDKKTLSLHAELTRALNLQDQLGADNNIGGQADTDTIMGALRNLQTNLNWSADSIDARHQAIQETSVSVDQMAAAGSPYSNTKVTFDAQPTYEQVAEHLNTRYTELMSAAKTEPTVVMSIAPPANNMAPELAKVGAVHSTGARVISYTALKNLGRLVQMTEAQKVIYDQIMRSLGTKEYKIIAGTQQQITDYQKANALTTTSFEAGVNGVVSIGDRTIYLLNPSVETLVHELVHASSYETVLAHYNGQNVGAEVKDAIARMEVLMHDFMNKPVNESISAPVRQALDDARAAVQVYLDAVEMDPAVAKASAMNEFMAWALTNNELTSILKDTKANKLIQLAKDVIKAIKQLIWGKKLAPKLGDDFLSNLQFNASVIIRTQPSLSGMIKAGTLYHAQSGMTDRLRNVREAFSLKIADVIKQHVDLTEFVPKDLLNASPALRMSADLALNVQAIFGLSSEETHTFQLMVGGLATEADIDPNALARAQELYVHVAKNLKVEDFVPANAVDPESERYYAQQKYDVIMGKTLRRLDAQGRTTMLPVFMALATTNDEFRKILENIPVPKSPKNTEKTLDAAIENAGSKMMDTLSARLSGENTAPNVRASIDNLNTHIHEVAVDEQTLISEVLAKTGGISDSINDWMVGGIQTLSDKGMELGNKLTADNSKASKVAGNFVKLVSAMATEANGAVVAEDVIASTNKMNLWRPMREFINGLVGRTDSNADVYDMIKRVRAMVQQLRQNFRDEVPRVIASKFTRAMSDAEYSTMFKSMGKTDLAVLRDTMPAKDVLNLFKDQTELDNQINDLEALIQKAQPATKYWTITRAKMQQLANFMNTGETGSNLLRNAQAIANLLGENRGKDWRIPNADTINKIDKLVTLYAIDELSQVQKNEMASLVQNESKGLSFTLDYLVGQRKTEQRKALQPKTQYNYYKGHIQSDQQTGVSMVVESDTMAGELRLRGYTRIGDYVGSDIDTKRESMGYYFAPLSGRTAVSQGIMQNVKHTASGVDSATGFSSTLTAGRVSEPIKVKAYAQRMKQETHVTENLVPVYDESGKVIAFERSVDPKMMDKLNRSEHLPSMLGVWRGRQIEERMSSIVNEELIDNLHTMYTKDINASSKNQAQYVNVFGKGLDTVQKDVIGLFSDETKAYINKKFGDEFYVRKDLLEDVIGFRNASVGDFWTGNSRFSKNTNDSVAKFIVGLMGINAYKNLVKIEQILQNVVSLARTNIVVRSVIIPVFNSASNVYQLISRGVPIASIVRGAGSKVAEIDHYAKSRLRQIQLEAELRAVGDDVFTERKLRTEIKSITDSHKRMSIWPLINAGEFSTVADVGMSAEDLQLTSGDLQGYIQQQVDKLPDGLRTAARYGLLTRDTALFQGLQKAVHYGDFVAKAILYDDLTKRKGLTEEQALARVTEEFVNYDRLSSRSRTYLENMGLMWFYNYKIRIAKVALSTLRNNPFHALVSASMPAPNSVGLPIQDNVFSKAVGGDLGWSLGPDMAIRGMGMNPWYNLVN